MTSFRFALPLGISFMTFTITAYVVDTYRSQYPVEKKLQRLLAYVLFFPHLIAGPILRPNELLPQFSHWTRAIDARFTLGVCLFANGLTKKLVFADIIAGAVDHVYASTAQQLSAWEYLLAIHGFSVQIYCDFSGYTDMAIGTACILGIRLPINFRRPYAAHSIIDFWRRWHITLSSWLRDYLYIPLGGNRNGEGRRLLNLMTTMVLGGLWHGAAWTFVIWGALHGTALVGVHLLRARLARWNIVVPAWLGILGTFYFVTFAWVYFRAPDIGTAHRVLQRSACRPLGRLPNVRCYICLRADPDIHLFGHSSIRYACARAHGGAHLEQGNSLAHHRRDVCSCNRHQPRQFGKVHLL